MPTKPKTYEQALAQARRLLAEARLSDPDEHFPYRHAEVLALLEASPPMGAGVRDRVDGAEDRSRLVSDFMTREIADASKAYIDAQAAYLADPSDENRSRYETTRDLLVAARLDHRQNRGAAVGVGKDR